MKEISLLCEANPIRSAHDASPVTFWVSLPSDPFCPLSSRWLQSSALGKWGLRCGSWLAVTSSRLIYSSALHSPLCITVLKLSCLESPLGTLQGDLPSVDSLNMIQSFTLQTRGFCAARTRFVQRLLGNNPSSCSCICVSISPGCDFTLAFFDDSLPLPAL